MSHFPSCSAVGSGPGDVVHTIINVGGFTEVYVVGTGPNPFELRTFQSSDGSVTIIENANDIDLQVQVVDPTQCFQVDSVATLMTNANTFTTLATLTGSAKVLEFEEWKINMCVLVCVPFGLGSTATNSEVRWSVETAAAVFTEFDRYSSRDQIAISGNQQSQPMHRTKQLLAAMDAPRMLVECRRTTAGSTNFLWEIPRWGGTQIEVAP